MMIIDIVRLKKLVHPERSGLHTTKNSAIATGTPPECVVPMNGIGSSSIIGNSFIETQAELPPWVGKIKYL